MTFAILAFHTVLFKHITFDTQQPRFFFQVQCPHIAFPTYLSLGTHKAHLLLWSQVKPSQSLTKEWKGTQDGPWGHAGFAAPIAENNALFFPLSSLQSKHFLLHQELKEHFLCTAMQAAKFALGSPVAQQYAEAWLELYKKAFDLYLEFSI